MEVTVKKIYEDTYAITEEGLLGSANCYLLIGNERALLIDTAYGISNLRKVISKVTEKEVICALTHGHMDHADGCFQFDEVYMHSGDRKLYSKHTSFDFVEDAWLNGISINKTPVSNKDNEVTAMLEKLKNAAYKVPEKLEKVSCFDLGGRIVSWINIPGHTEGSVCYYDEKYNMLFTGDSITERVWLFLPESSEVNEYEENMKRLGDFIKVSRIKGIYPGHGSHSLDTNAVDDLIACCDMYEEENEKGKDFILKVGSGKIFRKNRFRLLTK